MFFNQHDVVEAAGKKYLVVSLENETLIVYDTVTDTVSEIPKAHCKRVSTMADIRTKAIYESSMGTIAKIIAIPKLMDFLSKCPWIENASMNHPNNDWFYNTLNSMETRNNLTTGVVKEFYRGLRNIKPGEKSNLVISGNFNDAKISVKLTLVNKNGVVGVCDVKRIFGDDGVFGNIAKSDNAVKPDTTQRKHMCVA